MHAEAAIFAIEADLRDVKEMLPECAITGSPGLQIRGRLTRFGEPRLVGSAGRDRCGIDLFEIVHRDRRLTRIGAGESRFEIDRRDVAMADFRDELSHLQAPVAEMDIARHSPGIGAEKALQRVADDRRAQVSESR